MPRVIVHVACSLDGRTDSFTPDIGQFYRLASTFGEDATLAGCDTLLSGTPADAPGAAEVFEPPATEPNDERPLLVVPDSRGRLRAWGRLWSAGYWRKMVALCTSSTPAEQLVYLDQMAVERIVAGDDRVDLRAALEQLGERYGIERIRVDSGGSLNGALLVAGLVDEVSLVVHPVVATGATPRPIFDALLAKTIAEATRLERTHVEQLASGCLWLKYRVVG